jgi:hypothetical protein
VTALAAEPAPGAECSLSDRGRHLGEWIEALAACSRAHRQLTIDELAEGIPALAADQEAAAKRLEAAYKPAEALERDIAGLDGEISRADAERATWLAQLEGGTVAERVVARQWVSEWDGEISALKSRRDFMHAELLPLIDARNKARASLEQANGALEGRKLNATPPLAYFGAGQKTAAYSTRFGLALETTLRDRDDEEHDAAVDYMLHLCRVSGFRTEDYADVLPSDAEQARRFYDRVYADASASALADPTPGAADVMARMEAEFRAEPPPSYEDDYRDPRTAVPRNLRVPEYRQVQTLRDLGIR